MKRINSNKSVLLNDTTTCTCTTVAARIGTHILMTLPSQHKFDALINRSTMAPPCAICSWFQRIRDYGLCVCCCPDMLLLSSMYMSVFYDYYNRENLWRIDNLSLMFFMSLFCFCRGFYMQGYQCQGKDLCSAPINKKWYNIHPGFKYTSKGVYTLGQAPLWITEKYHFGEKNNNSLPQKLSSQG